MRYRYEEFAPSNKKQYVIAVGVHELRALVDAAKIAKMHCPQRTQEEKERFIALRASIKGLNEAIAYAEKTGDNGKRRGAYQPNPDAAY